MKLSPSVKPTDSSRPPRPSLGQLKAWQQDEISQWVFKQLRHHFPDYRDLLPVKQMEQSLMVNYRKGCNDVLEAIDRLIESGEI